MFGVKKFHHYLFGRTFTICSNHKPLQHFFSGSRPIPQLASARIQRWALTLSATPLSTPLSTAQALRWACNLDSLIRLPPPEATTLVPLPGEKVHLMETLYTSPISPAQLKKSTVHDPVLSHVLEAVRTGWHNLEGEEFQPFNRKGEELSVQDCCLLWGSRLVIPEAMRLRVLEELHAGHPGVSCMKAIALSIVWWPGIDGKIEAKVLRYSEYQVNQNSPAAAPMHPWKWPARPWSRVFIDNAGPFLTRCF